ncbi:MAG: hypothetical protein JNM66_25980 [Bryobacterales bacterium]|nr:hypothetical protein [Bryobacterales bacterium]
MSAVGHRLVAAIGPMHVAGGVALAFMSGGAIIRIGGANGNSVLVIVVTMAVVEVPIVQIIDVPLMDHGRMPTAGAVDMGVLAIGVNLV